MKTALLALLLTTMPACMTVVRIPCETDPCGVTTSAARPRTAEQIQIVRKGEPMPAGAKMLSTFESPPPEPCSDASLALFRGKAARLGFDGVGNIEEKNGAEGRVCTGQAFVLAGAK